MVTRRQVLAGAGTSLGAGYVGWRRLEAGSRVAVERVETFDLALYVNDMGGVTDPADLDGGRRVALTDLPPRLRGTVRAAAESESLAYGVANPPERLAAVLERYEYVRVDGAYYSIHVWESADLPVEIDARVVDSSVGPGDDAELAFELRNRGGESAMVFGAPPHPFGVLYAARTDAEDGFFSGDGRLLLWRADYRGAWILGQPVGLRHPVGSVSRLGAGDSLDRTYAIRGGITGPPVGTYVLDDWVGIAFDYRDGANRFPFRVAFSIR